jgi:hypothetical protein
MALWVALLTMFAWDRLPAGYDKMAAGWAKAIDEVYQKGWISPPS